jgi:hypothetical protein
MKYQKVERLVLAEVKALTKFIPKGFRLKAKGCASYPG